MQYKSSFFFIFFKFIPFFYWTLCCSVVSFNIHKTTTLHTSSIFFICIRIDFIIQQPITLDTFIPPLFCNFLTGSSAQSFARMEYSRILSSISFCKTWCSLDKDDDQGNDDCVITGPPVLRPFLQDVVQFGALGRTILGLMVKDPIFSTKVLPS